jgi:hypothetical protein
MPQIIDPMLSYFDMGSFEWIGFVPASCLMSCLGKSSARFCLHNENSKNVNAIYLYYELSIYILVFTCW